MTRDKLTIEEHLVLLAVKSGKRRLVEIAGMLRFSQTKHAIVFKRGHERGADAALQKLRRKGLVRFDRATGWGAIAQ